ncbi:hypothetical protein V490_08031 [Pseudogymnoascus sp. VKM F-3557]|nr:hypothetical protein V490_08031 [Pseudogymnoascus sp. VKM F-3557]
MEKPITVKILMIHGYGQSGPHLDIKTSRLQRALREALTSHTGICDVGFCFPTAPCRVLIPDLPDPNTSQSEEKPESLDMWTWCMDYSSGNKFFDESKTISDLNNALDSIAEIIRQHGPFDGIIGFSSGASIAALVASLLEEGRKQAFEKRVSKNGMSYPNSFLREDKFDGKHKMLQVPLKFVVCYSGFSLDHPMYSAFYKPQIQTPILHVLGKWDTVVEEQQSLSLARKCGRKSTLFYHLGSHFVPQQSCYISMARDFVLDACTISSIENYAQFAAPLYPLTGPMDWTWTSTQKLAFAQLKQQVVNHLQLYKFDPLTDLHIMTDASFFAIGGWLFQTIEGKLRSIALVSRGLSPAERNYTTTERELLAIVFTVKKWRHYLESTRANIIIFTDHKAITQ